MLLHTVLPLLSLVLVGVGGWFIGMRSLVSNVVTEDYVAYAELGGVIALGVLCSYVMRNALVPQVTGLAMSVGGIFNGAVITEKVFAWGDGAIIKYGKLIAAGGTTVFNPPNPPNITADYDYVYENYRFPGWKE